MDMDKKEILRNIGFFSTLEEKDLLLIADISKEVNYEQGTTIFKEGEKAGSLFIVIDGTVKIYKDADFENKKVLASFSKMDVFGELSVFDELPRSATAVSSLNTKCLVINSGDLNKLMSENQEFTVRLLKQVIKTVSSRIRITNEKLQNNIFWGITASL